MKAKFIVTHDGIINFMTMGIKKSFDNLYNMIVIKNNYDFTFALEDKLNMFDFR